MRQILGLVEDDKLKPGPSKSELLEPEPTMTDISEISNILVVPS